MSSFAALILTHGRPDRVHTIASLRRSGYTGRIVLVLDNEDRTLDEYRVAYPDEEIVVFDKKAVWDRIDNYTNAGDRRAIVYARNAAFDVARDLGLDCFVQLDDDYTDWHHRIGPDGEYLSSCEVRDLDAVFEAMRVFLYESGATTVALAQGGDLLGGAPNSPCLKRMQRKAMNSFFCRTDRPFEFSGRINEDVNAYVGEAARGALFATVGYAHLNQVQTQASDGGMSDVYRDGGTYVKSMYTVLANPSSVRVGMMGVHPRLHHVISWDHAVPVILREQYRKGDGPGDEDARSEGSGRRLPRSGGED